MSCVISPYILLLFRLGLLIFTAFHSSCKFFRFIIYSLIQLDIFFLNICNFKFNWLIIYLFFFIGLVSLDPS